MDNTEQVKPTESIITTSYTIPKDEYIYYNLLYASNTLAIRRKKAYMIGGIELVTGIIILITLIMGSGGDTNQLLYIGAAVLIGFGFYSIFFHLFVIPNSIKKQAAAQFDSGSSYAEPITLNVYNNRIEQLRSDGNIVNYWQHVKSFHQSEKIYVIYFEEGKTLLIPKKSIGDDKFMLEEIFSTIAKKYNKPFSKWKEPVYR